MSNNDIYDVAIIGGGPAGLTAGIYAKRAALKVVLIEKAAFGGQITISADVENYTGFSKISGAELSQKMHQHAQSVDLEFRRKLVESIKLGLDYHEIQLEGGESITAHTVIIATGGSPRKLKIPGENKNSGAGVSYCAVCDGFLFQDRVVMVSGGGDSAVEEALYLSKLASKVYIVHRRDELRASRILQQRAFNECKIEILWNSVATDILAGDEGVNAVKLKNTQTGEISQIEVDGVFIFIGFNPNNQLIPTGVNMDAEGYIITDEKCETSIPGVFAVGDIRKKFARQIATAVSDGCVAALAAARYLEDKKPVSDDCKGPGDLLKTAYER